MSSAMGGMVASTSSSTATSVSRSVKYSRVNLFHESTVSLLDLAYLEGRRGGAGGAGAG